MISSWWFLTLVLIISIHVPQALHGCIIFIFHQCGICQVQLTFFEWGWGLGNRQVGGRGVTT